MKGCLSLIIKIIIAVLVFFGLEYLGIVDFVKEKIGDYKTSSQEQIIEKNRDFIDLSQLDEEYSVEKSFQIFKNKMIIAEHNATGQKIIILEPKDGTMISKFDIENDNIKEKLEKISRQKQLKAVKLENIQVTKKGTLKGLNQDIPYAKVTAEISNLPIKSVEGIIGSATLENGKNILIISINEKGKYSQIITDAFFNKVK